MYYQIKYTYRNYDESKGLPHHEYELYKRVLFFFKKFISITYKPTPGVPIVKEVIE